MFLISAPEAKSRKRRQHEVISSLRIIRRFNTTGKRNGRLTASRWKAQNKSLLIFAGGGYNVEQGVSNEVFSQRTLGGGGCVFNPTPERLHQPSVSGTPLLPASAFIDTVTSRGYASVRLVPSRLPATPLPGRGSYLFVRT